MAQTEYARSHLDTVPGREHIRERVRDLLDVETYDSVQNIGSRYFFRKRLPGQEQPCIFFREGWDGGDQLLIDPSGRGTGKYTAVKPIRVSPDGRLLLYEIKEGGERTGRFELLEVNSRKTLQDVLPRGYLRGFIFAPDSQGFYYVHEAARSEGPYHCAAYYHALGTGFDDDQEVFVAGESARIRMYIIAGKQHLGFLVFHFADPIRTDFYLCPLSCDETPWPLIRSAEFKIRPSLLDDGRTLALTDLGSENRRIVEVRPNKDGSPEFVDVIPARDFPIRNWLLAGERIFVSYFTRSKTRVDIFDLSGQQIGQVSTGEQITTRLAGASADGEELFFEQESFTSPIRLYSYSCSRDETRLWTERRSPVNSEEFCTQHVFIFGSDGESIPMFLVGRQEVVESGCHPTIMTAYGGFGISMTPQFSLFVAFLLKLGCLFALPNIHGGREFGVRWHTAAKRRNRQQTIDDFLAAADWLVKTGRTTPSKLGIFGGSNSGLLVGAALTQRPDLFRAVICMSPILDMLRYHLFDQGHVWEEEFGTAEDADDFAALLNYSPYQNVRDGVAYPAVMIVSGALDQKCNPLHARKMTARLQTANVSPYPILLDYSAHRGHSPVLPLHERIEGLTDRLAFLCEELQLQV